MSKIHDDNDLTVSAFNRDDNEPTVTAVRKDATVIMNTAELEEKLRRARQEALNEAGIKRDYVLSPDGELDFDALLRDEEGFESEPQEDGDDDYDEEEAEAPEASEASPAAKRIIARRAEEKRRHDGCSAQEGCQGRIERHHHLPARGLHAHVICRQFL